MHNDVNDLEFKDRPRLIRGKRFGILGAICSLVGATCLIVSVMQTEPGSARSIYIALMAVGLLGIYWGQKTLRPLMKKYLRPFPFIS